MKNLKYEEIPLHLGFHKGYLDIVQLLIEKRININEEDNDGNCPLYIACYNQDLDIIELLIEKECIVNITEHHWY